MYCSCALATACCDCTTSTVSVTPALKRSRDWTSACSAKSMLLRATFTRSAEDCVVQQSVAVNAAPVKERNGQCPAHVEDLRCPGRVRPSGSIIRVKGKRWE